MYLEYGIIEYMHPIDKKIMEIEDIKVRGISARIIKIKKIKRNIDLYIQIFGSFLEIIDITCGEYDDVVSCITIKVIEPINMVIVAIICIIPALYVVKSSDENNG